MRRFATLVFLGHPLPPALAAVGPGGETMSPYERAGEGLRSLLAESHLHLWNPSDPIPSEGRRFLIGAATWCGYDMRLLDVLETAASRGRTGHDRIDVFNFDDWSILDGSSDYQGALDRYIPGMDVGHIYHSPVVGLWVNGILKETGSGFKGRELVATTYDLSGEWLPNPDRLWRRIRRLWRRLGDPGFRPP